MKYSSSRRMIVVCIVGFLLAMGPLMAEWALRGLHGGGSDSHEETSDSVSGEAMEVGYLFCWLGRLLGYPVGTGLVLLAATSWYVRRRLISGHEAKTCTSYAVLIPLVANLYVAVQPLVFLTIPRGAAIRPMGWAVLILGISAVVTVGSLVYVVRYIKKNRAMICGFLGILLSLLPLFTAFFSFHLIVRLKGLVLAP